MEIESVGGRLLLGLNTTIIAMGIVFIVLILLAVIIVIQSKILGLISNKPKEIEPEDNLIPKEAKPVKPQVYQKGIVKGKASITGVENEEQVAVIMSAVSAASNMPISSLKIRSIRKVDDLWNKTGRVEMINQRL